MATNICHDRIESQVDTALPFHAPSNEELSRAIARIIPAEQWRAVMEGNPYTECEINDEFLGLLTTYWHLAQLIPSHWTVVDLGCGYNPQAWLFHLTGHHRFISVDSFPNTIRFHTPTSTHYTMTIGDFITQHGHTLNLKETFAICSYCPMWGGRFHRTTTRVLSKPVRLLPPSDITASHDPTASSSPRLTADSIPLNLRRTMYASASGLAPDLLLHNLGPLSKLRCHAGPRNPLNHTYSLDALSPPSRSRTGSSPGASACDHLCGESESPVRDRMDR